MYHIYTTYVSDNEYIKYSEHGPRGINVQERTLLIRGGTGIHRKNIVTPLGVHTAVEDEDYEWLKDNFSFKQHMAGGYIVVKKQKTDPEVAAADMVTHDRKTDACPIVPQDFRDGGDKETVRPMEGKKKKAA